MGRTTMTSLGVLGLYTETPLHCGAESGSGYVDLPIQRERHTRYPVIPGSTLKGVLRDEMTPEERLGKAKVQKIFGSDQRDEPSPGIVSFGDGLIVAFPVRSSGAPFHWVTCPFVLERLGRLFGGRAALVPPKPPEAGHAWGKTSGEVLLEEIRLTVESKPEFFDGNGGSGLAALLDLLPDDARFAHTRRVFPDRLLIVRDEDFKELVETGTDVLTRIKLNDLGTTTTLTPERAEELKVEDREGNLFVEEVVPPETLFACSIRSTGNAVDLDEKLGKLPLLRVGGDETIGRGLTHLRWLPTESGSANGKEE